MESEDVSNFGRLFLVVSPERTRRRKGMEVFPPAAFSVSYFQTLTEPVHPLGESSSCFHPPKMDIKPAGKLFS